MAEHTGLPWRFVPSHVAEGDAEVRHPDGWLICCTPSDELANRIVRALNTQPAVADLVKALEGLLRRIDNHFNSVSDPDYDWKEQTEARSALSRFRELEKENG